MADTIKEFLVSLGFKVNEGEFNKGVQWIEKATAKIVNLGVGATAAAASVAASVAKIADQYEELYFVSLRAGSTVNNLQTFAYGSRAIGIEAGAAAASLEGLNMQLKLNPGKEALANMLGVKTAGRETKDVFNDLIGVFAKMSRSGPMGFGVAANYAGQFGMDPSTMLRRIQMRETEAEAEGRYAEKLKDSGLNLGELSRKSLEYNQSLRDLGSSIGLVWDQTANKWLPTMTSTVNFLTKIADVANRAGKETDGFTSTVISLVAALGGLKALSWVMRLIPGLGGAGAALGGATGAVASVVGAPLALAGGLSLVTAMANQNPDKDKVKLNEDNPYIALRQILRLAKPGLQRMLGVDDAAQAGAGTPGAKAAKGNRAQQTIDYFMSQGWSREAAAGIAASASRESNFNHNALGDGGRAYGAFQWHPDRQAAFKAWSGKDIQGSTYEEQMAFVHHELTKGGEQDAGRRLKGASSAAGAGSIVSQYYERPGDAQGEAFRRAKLANEFFNTSLTSAPAASGTSSGGQLSQTNNITVNGASDPGRTADLVGKEVRSANQDLARNAGTNVR